MASIVSRGIAGSIGTALVGSVRTLTRTASATALDLTTGVLAGADALAAAFGGTDGDGRPAGAPVLRVEVVILSDESGRPLIAPAALQPALDTAERVFTEHAGMRIRVASVRVVGTPAPTVALDPRANRELLLADVLGHTSFYRAHVTGPAALASVGTPVTVVVVRNIAGRTTGCSLGMSADWVIAQASLFDAARPTSYDETVLVHELGHALNLPHHRDPENLMFPTSSPPGQVRGTRLARWQAAILHANHRVLPARRTGSVRD